MSRMRDRVAIVTGAGGLIGATTAARIVEEGGAVLLVDSDEERLRDVAAGLQTDSADYVAADVTDSAAVSEYTNRAVEKFGGLDAVVLNAGIFGDGSMIDAYDETVFDRVLEVNMKGTWHGIRAAVPHLRSRGRGSIVITSSTQGISAYFASAAYTTSKHAVLGMARSAAMDLAADKIRVNAVHPGITDTAMMAYFHELGNPDDPASVQTAWEANIPMKRYADPREIANVMLFLVSDESSYCTGSSFVVDGGLSAFHGGPMA
ncbi:SDR family oxidoreductase [Gordonia sp. TBRC 11910]|uniref:SDR family oxidoreductase n=1 Tax=Gordonia asplenii TaxID=2725283 RepID=A0A848L0X3_9ACTN|nr:SDR family NAD(P)-dependent oxidoreductase [Gordonia asplenii]NMO04349.1 SDR family oxidoreductase [Gordonia asplenii]